jgi:hypothetical protein
MLCDMPNECFRRTNGLVLAKAVMYCEGHKASFSASYIYTYIYVCIVCVCQFFLWRASQEGVQSSCQHVFAARSCFEYQH